MNRLIVRLETLVVFGLPAVILVLTGLGFLVAALYMTLSRGMEPAGAALVTGAVCFAGAVLLTVVGWLVLRSLAARRKPVEDTAHERAPDAARMAMVVGEVVGGDLQFLVRRHRYGMIGAALAAGFAVGVSPKLRRSLLRLLGN